METGIIQKSPIPIIAISLIIGIAVMISIFLIDESNQPKDSDQTEYCVTTIINGESSTVIAKSNEELTLPDISNFGIRTYWVDVSTCERIQSPIKVTTDMTVKAVWENDASSYNELCNLIKSNTPVIRITSDIGVDSPIFIGDTKKIYCDKDFRIYKFPGYTKELFIIGEDENHNKTILSNKTPALILGNDDTKGTLVIDGNNIESEGSAITVVHSGRLDIYSDVVIKNCMKTSNELLLSDRYFTSYPSNIGGAAIANINGTINIYGGLITDNSSSTVDGEPAYCGGAIYNYGHLRMYGGTIKNNTAARGGAIFNYRMLNIESGTIAGNVATKYAGAVYCADSQYVNVFFGKAGANSDSLIIENNSAQQAGGVLFAKTNCSIVVLGGTTFRNNESVNSHGGVFYVGGTLTVSDAVFENNKAGSQGGAIQIHYGDSEKLLTPRMIHIENSTFTGNYAKNGGALYNVTTGKLTVESCSFLNNTATNNGGALYLYTSSNSNFEDVLINENTASTYGGALYMSGSAKAYFTDVTSTGNTAENGGFLYITTTNSEITLLTGKITSNYADAGSFFYGNAKKCYIHLGSTLVYDGTKANKYSEGVI